MIDISPFARSLAPALAPTEVFARLNNPVPKVDVVDGSLDQYEPPLDLSDDELTALALAADPYAPIDPDAVPWRANADDQRSFLPVWYMPRPMAIGRGRTTKIIIISIIVGFLLIDAFGLCVTSGFISLA
jgi:hypothetical protein